MNDDYSYPYRYAAEYIREHYGPQEERIAGSGEAEAGFVSDRPKLSISQADKILTGICRDGGLNAREVARKLADRYFAERAERAETQMKKANATAGEAARAHNDLT